MQGAESPPDAWALSRVLQKPTRLGALSVSRKAQRRLRNFTSTVCNMNSSSVEHARQWENWRA